MLLLQLDVCRFNQRDQKKNCESAWISSHFQPIEERFCVNDPHMFEPAAQKVSTITLTECEKQLQSLLLFPSYAVESYPGSVSADLYDVIAKLTSWMWGDITSLYPVIVEFQNLHTNTCIVAKNTFGEVDLKPPNSTKFILKKFLPGMPRDIMFTKTGRNRPTHHPKTYRLQPRLLFTRRHKNLELCPTGGGEKGKRRSRIP